MRRARMGQTGGTVEGSLNYGGEAHTSPLWLLATAGICGLAWFIFSILQITSTEQAVFHLLQSTFTLKPGMTAQQLLDLQNGSMDQTNLEAAGIGWAVQIFMLLLSFPSEHYIHPALGRLRRFVMIILVGGDIVTDGLYVLAGHQVFSGFGFAPGGFGVLIVAVIYPIAICGVTVFCGLELAHRLDRLFSRLRSL
ncbi:MAG: hypothetical protein H0U76_25810 [Ktedonobacteraceae bacterium]|nr:hypothetical protein [Ktedonobacteraceae bacterium]